MCSLRAVPWVKDCRYTWGAYTLVTRKGPALRVYSLWVRGRATMASLPGIRERVSSGRVVGVVVRAL